MSHVATAPSIRLSGSAHIGGTRIFGPLSLEVSAGRWTCLLGPSGAGKSTVLRLLAGLGEGIAFDGQISAGDGRPLPSRVMMMAQNDLLLPWLDVLGNVTLGARLRREPVDTARAHDLIARVGLADHLAKKPAALSGGQRQRAALARTLMEDRPVVLLDEPFSALDALTRARMQELAATLFRGRTVLLVTHDPAEAARLGDRIAVLTGDGLREVAPPDTPSIRDFDSAGVLSCQARLLRILRPACG